MKPTQIIELFMKGRENEAREMILSCAPFLEIKDSFLHFEMHKVMFCLGLDALAKKELELSIRDDSNNIEAIFSLAQVYADNAEIEKTEKIFLKAIKNNSQVSEIYIRYGSFLENQERYLDAVNLYKKALDSTGEKIFKTLIADREKNYESDEIEESNIIEPEDMHLLKFLQLFRSREGFYAKQWKNAKGEQGYAPINEPLTLNVVRNHILGNLTIGVYQLRIDNSVCFIAFDIDIDKSKIADYFQKPSERRRIDALLLEVSQNLFNICASMDIISYIEDSGYKGRHVWIFLRQGIQANKAKSFGNYILSKIKNLPNEINIELFPKQAFVKSNGLGNLIKIPLGIHIKSGRRSIFLNPDGTEPLSQLIYLSDIKLNDKEVILKYSEEQKNRTNNSELQFKKDFEKSLSEKLNDSDALSIEDSYSLPEKPIPFVLEEDIEYMIIYSSCPVISNLCKKAFKSLGLSTEEIQVLKFTLGNLTNGNLIVNEILNKAGISDSSIYLKRAFRTNPMGCVKIKNLIPYVTSNFCLDCFTLKKIIGYPNPLIHLYKKDNFTSIDALILNFIEISKRKEDIDSTYSLLLDKIKNEFDLLNLQEHKVGNIKIFFDQNKMLQLMDGEKD